MILLVFGMRKTGKTELTRQISYYLARQSLVLVSDPIGQWPQDYARKLEDLQVMSSLPPLMTFRTDDPTHVAYTAKRLPPCVAIFDEMDFLCNARGWKNDDTGEETPAGRDICLRGRHIQPGGVGLVLNTQRAVNCHSDLKSLYDKVAVFRLQHPLDLKAFDEWMGPDVADVIAQLPDHYFVLYPDELVCKLGMNGAPAEQMTFDEFYRRFSASA